MPSSVVHVAVGLTLAVGLLGSRYDRRALLVVLAVLLLPEVDTLAGFALEGAHRALLHNAVLVVVAGGVLYWQTTREDAWLRRRFGARGVHVAWVALFVHAFAHVALDWTHLEGVDLFYPLYDRFFRLEGRAYLSATEGFVQTFLEVSTDPDTGQPAIDAGQGGTTDTTHVSSPAQPSEEPQPGPVDRRFPLAVQGWQLYLVAVGAFTLVAKWFQGSEPKRPDEA